MSYRNRVNYGSLFWITGNKATTSGAFASVKIEMPKSSSSILPAIVEIEIEHPRTSTLVSKYSKVALTDQELDAMPDLDDAPVIFKGQRQSSTNGVPNTGQPEETIERIKFSRPVPIRHSDLYMLFEQDSGSSHTYRFRIGWVNAYIPGAIQEDAITTKTQH